MAKTKKDKVDLTKQWEMPYTPGACSDQVPPFWNPKLASKMAHTQNKVNKDDH